MVRIVHASIDENKQIKGGQAGDQTGKEVCIRNWYSKPWSVLLRHPKKEIADKIAELGEKLANSNLVGYDQNQRNTLHDTLKLFNHDVDAYLMSHTKAETDCSAFVTECAIASGIQTLEYKGNAPTTSTMEKTFSKAGFQVMKQSRYLTSDKYLKRGDILVKAGSHTVIVIDNSDEKEVEYFPTYKGRSNSISNALYDMKIDSSKSNRKKIYEANFPDKYAYTAYQNTEMLNKLKSGLLIKP